MKRTILILALVTVAGSLFAQRKTTTSATIAFDASTPIDALPKAENKTVIAAIDTKTGAVQFEANVKNFAFSNPTIQDHFNGERWLNSGTHPTFTFKGTLTNPSEVNFAQDGTYNANVEGVLTIRGKEQKLKAPATIVVKDGVVSATSSFTIKLADYEITGSAIDGGKIAKEPKITVSADFK
jgi:polyisoprenoid-binding protein YceI